MLGLRKRGRMSLTESEWIVALPLVMDSGGGGQGAS